jgi:hypothetical protein
MFIKLVFAVLAAGLLVWLARAQWQAAARRKAARAGYFADVAGLFDRVVTRIQPNGFARMTGHLGACAFDLQAVPDSLTFRKLPALWVMVTLPEPLPLQATLDVMARPTGGEPFSHFAALRHSLPCPDYLPEGAAVRSDDAALVDAGFLEGPSALFADARVKELVISPKGLRLVILAEEADRGMFLLFRDAEVGGEPLAATRISDMLETLLALRAEIFRTREA